MKRSQGFNEAFDLFSLGVMMLESLTAKPPTLYCLSRASLKTVAECKESCIMKQNIPNNISQALKELIEWLTLIHASCRLGRNDIDDVKTHDFFQGIDWSQLLRNTPDSFTSDTQPTYDSDDDSASSEEEFFEAS